ncbi:Autophagy protein 22, partial [Dissophora ornata]
YVGYGWVSAWLLVPLLIQDMASKNGVLASDHSLPCDMTVPGYKAFEFFTSSNQAYRKTLLIIFSFLGGLNAFGYFIIQSPKLYWVGIILSPLGWAFYNLCGVFSHSYLPIYGRIHPDVLAAQSRGEPQNVIRKVEEQVVNDLSAYSSVISNIGSIFVYGVCIGISLGLNETTIGLQISIAFTGVWWFMWMMIVAPWLEARPGSPMPEGKNWIVYSWKNAYKTMASFRKLPEIFKFLMAWFILSDGINTIPTIIFIILYRELAFTHVHSLIISVVLSLTAAIGAFAFMYIRKIWALSTKFMILTTLGLYAVMMTYFVVAPYVTENAGLRNSWEGWASVIYIGLIVSTFHVSSRVILSELCPEGDENEWFSLYLLADKGSSWMGPFITGAIFTATGSYRASFWFPLGLIVAGALLLTRVDMDKGKEQAKQFATEKRKQLASAE